MRALPGTLGVAFTWSHPGGRTGQDSRCKHPCFLGALLSWTFAWAGVEHGILDLDVTESGNLETVEALEISQLGVRRG